MEYIVVVMYLVVGFVIPPVNETIPGAAPATLLRHRDVAAEERQPEQWKYHVERGRCGNEAEALDGPGKVWSGMFDRSIPLYVCIVDIAISDLLTVLKAEGVALIQKAYLRTLNSLTASALPVTAIIIGKEAD
jgi:hypothetical protein